jgi:hypothetical protein
MQESLQEHLARVAVHISAILLILMEKGIVSGEEIENAKMRATHGVEQAMAMQREAFEKEFDEKHPGTREFLKKISGGSLDIFNI